MPLYKPTDETLLKFLADNGASVEVDEGVDQCYKVTLNTGEIVDVAYGAPMSEWYAKCAARPKVEIVPEPPVA